MEGGRGRRGRRRAGCVEGAGLGEESRASGDARLPAKVLLLQLEKGPEPDEGGPATAVHVGNNVLEALDTSPTYL